MALPIPRTTAAEIPEAAAGRRTQNIVWVRVAPSPKDASRKSFGTAESASSDTETIVGSAIIPRITEAAAHEKPLGISSVFCRKLHKTSIPKNPYTTDGIPARSSTAGFTASRSFFGAA